MFPNTMSQFPIKVYVQMWCTSVSIKDANMEKIFTYPDILLNFSRKPSATLRASSAFHPLVQMPILEPAVLSSFDCSKTKGFNPNLQYFPNRSVYYIYVCMYIYIYMHVCVCLCVCVCRRC